MLVINVYLLLGSNKLDVHSDVILFGIYWFNQLPYGLDNKNLWK